MKTTTTFSLIAAITTTLLANVTDAQDYSISNPSVSQSVETRVQTQQQFAVPNQSTQQQMMISPPAPPAPRLGFQGQMVYGVGMKILSVVPGSPAAQVGLEYGDIIVSINHFPITSLDKYRSALIEAMQHHGGVAQLNVKNVRGCVEHGIPMYVSVTARLLGPPMPLVAAAVGPVITNN